MNENFKVIVAGSRNFYDYIFAKKYLDIIFSKTPKENIVIVSGNARGADMIGERYAEENKLKLKIFKANWDLGKKAGYIRNQQMGDYADALIAFWDYESKGTKNMIDIAKKLGLKIRVIDIRNK